MVQAARCVESRSAIRPRVGVVLGSGLGAFSESLLHSVRIPYGEIPGMPVSTAVGHAGELVMGTVGANGRGTVDVAVMSGRFHLYEGYTAQQVTTGIRLFRELGIKRLVLTSAAGGMNLEFAKGVLVLISDHINLQAANPLIGPNDDALGVRFPDMTEAYSSRLRQLARESAEEAAVTIYDGVYAGVIGPSYETPAEIRFLKAIGADLVGMSMVMEVIAARHMDMEVLGISCVTNLAAGLGEQRIDHAEVLETGQRISGTLVRLLTFLLPKLDEE